MSTLRTLKKGQSLFLRVRLASELLGLDSSDSLLPIRSFCVKLDEIDGERVDPSVAASVMLQDHRLVTVL